MTRKLKTLGLAFVAALALSAVVASAASAETAVVVGGMSATGEDTSAPAKTELTGVGVKCTHSTYHVTVDTPSTITATPTLKGCATTTSAPVTITHNGCNYSVTLGPVGGTVKSMSFECPANKQIEVHAYGDAGHTVSTCTLEIGPQTPNSAGVWAWNQAIGLEISGIVTEIVNNLSGPCITLFYPVATNHNTRPSPFKASLHLAITIPGLSLETEEE